MRFGIERRVEALEAMRPSDDGPFVSFRSIVSPDHVEAPRAWAELDGMVVLRLAGETETEFMVRAKAEIVRTLPGRPAYRIVMHGDESKMSGAQA